MWSSHRASPIDPYCTSGLIYPHQFCLIYNKGLATLFDIIPLGNYFFPSAVCVSPMGQNPSVCRGAILRIGPCSAKEGGIL